MFDTEKEFTVAREKTNTYQYPSLKINNVGVLNKGEKFKSKRYTKAG
jgi:hypothetical protein